MNCAFLDETNEIHRERMEYYTRAIKKTTGQKEGKWRKNRRIQERIEKGAPIQKKDKQGIITEVHNDGRPMGDI